MEECGACFCFEISVGGEGGGVRHDIRKAEKEELVGKGGQMCRSIKGPATWGAGGYFLVYISQACECANRYIAAINRHRRGKHASCPATRVI